LATSLGDRDRSTAPYPRVELGTPSLGKTVLHPAGKGQNPSRWS